MISSNNDDNNDDNNNNNRNNSNTINKGQRIGLPEYPPAPTKSLDFRGFDSSKLLIIRGGNSHVR